MAALNRRGPEARGRRVHRFGSVAMLVTTLTAFAAVVVTLWTGGAFNTLICGGDCGAAAVRTPDELNFTPTEVTAADAPAQVAPELNAAAIRSAVADALDNDDELGAHVAFAAADARTGEVVASEGSGGFIPASTTKVLTAFTVLSKVDPQQRFTTSVVRVGNQVVLVGGGDPYLRSERPDKKLFGMEADIETLAERTAENLRAAGVTSVSLDYNASKFAGPAFNPAWEKSYMAEKIVTPISALWVDQGVVDGVRVGNPAAAAAAAFAEALDDAGIEVADEHRPVALPAGAAAVASVRSATVARITEDMIATSDNETAEVLLRHAALAAGRLGSFADGVATVREVLQASGIDTTGLALHDGSGLSRRNRIAPVTLAQTIAKAATTPRTAGLLADLPIANFSGTLDDRLVDEDAGKGVVRAKTGTLKNVHSLAGIVTDRAGTPIVFAVMIDQAKDIPEVEAEAALDAVPAALAACSCSARTVGS